MLRKRKKGKSALQNKLVKVYLKFSGDEILVGKLALHDRLIHFKYEENFMALGLNLSPFKLKFNTEIQVAAPDPFHGIFGVFDDSLPDGWGMLLLSRALLKRGLSLNDINVLDQLAYVGASGKGALIYRPELVDDGYLGNLVDLDLLQSAIDEVKKGTDSEVIEELLSMGGSSGGARPKAHIGYNKVTKDIIHSRNDLPNGYEHWMVKFPGSEDPEDSSNIEYAYHKMALAAGLDMSECRLLISAKGIPVFATKRFDRVGNNRIHMHSVAGLVHDNFRLSNIDYGHIMHVAYELEGSAVAREKVFRLAAFNIYSHNRDDHSKNFSWLMDEKGKWSMAPAYDLTYSSIGIDEHSTRVAGEGAYPGRKNLLELANEFSINKPNVIINEVQKAISQWPKFAEECGVEQESITRIRMKFIELSD